MSKKKADQTAQEDEMITAESSESNEEENAKSSIDNNHIATTKSGGKGALFLSFLAIIGVAYVIWQQQELKPELSKSALIQQINAVEEIVESNNEFLDQVDKKLGEMSRNAENFQTEASVLKKLNEETNQASYELQQRIGIINKQLATLNTKNDKNIDGNQGLILIAHLLTLAEAQTHQYNFSNALTLKQDALKRLEKDNNTLLGLIKSELKEEINQLTSIVPVYSRWQTNGFSEVATAIDDWKFTLEPALKLADTEEAVSNANDFFDHIGQFLSTFVQVEKANHAVNLTDLSMQVHVKERLKLQLTLIQLTMLQGQIDYAKQLTQALLVEIKGYFMDEQQTSQTIKKLQSLLKFFGQLQQMNSGNALKKLENLLASNRFLQNSKLDSNNNE